MKRTLIAVNTRMLLKDRLDGIGWFAYQTLKRLTTSHPEIDWLFLFDRPFDQSFIFGPNVTAEVVSPPIRHGLLYSLWYNRGVKRVLDEAKPDLFLSPDGILSLTSSCRQLAVVHDINFAHYPKDLPFFTARFFNHHFPLAVQHATRIATVSDYTKQDLIHSYHADPHRIEVIGSGSNLNVEPATEAEKQVIRNKHTAGQPYFLFVGSVHPRKNIPRLLQAFETYRHETPGAVKLVIAGSFFWGNKEIAKLQKTMHFGKDVIFTGRVDDATLRELYAGALALAYTPYFEGFGVPLLEAMHAGVPIIASKITSLPEVAGDAALYVDPFNVSSIARAMTLISADEALRKKLTTLGRARAEHFSWERATERLYAVILSCLKK